MAARHLGLGRVIQERVWPHAVGRAADQDPLGVYERERRGHPPRARAEGPRLGQEQVQPGSDAVEQVHRMACRSGTG